MLHQSKLTSKEKTFTTQDPILEWFLSHCHIRKYPEKSTIIHSGTKAETLYYLLQGSVAVYIKEDDHEMILSYLNKNEFFGESGLFDEKGVRTACVRARSSCQVAEISYARFQQIIQTNPQILMMLAGQLSRRLRNTSRRASHLAFSDVSKRVTQVLLDLAKMPDALTHPDGMQIKITRQEIGNMVGCSRETVGRVIRMLEEDNFIEAHGKTIVVYGTR